MPPFFIFIQTMILFLMYFIFNRWWILGIAMAYHAVWGLWFGIDHKALFHHSYYHTRMGAVAWAVVYSLLETLFIMHDLNLIQKSYFFLLMN